MRRNKKGGGKGGLELGDDRVIENLPRIFSLTLTIYPPPPQKRINDNEMSRITSDFFWENELKTSALGGFMLCFPPLLPLPPLVP